MLLEKIRKPGRKQATKPALMRQSFNPPENIHTGIEDSDTEGY